MSLDDMFSDLRIMSPEQVNGGPPADDDGGPPDPVDPSPVNDAYGLTCEVCGIPISYSGRGRKPKRCDDHKTRTSPRSRGGKPSGGRAPKITEIDPRIAVIVDDLQRGVGMVAGGMIPFAPVTGATIMLTSPSAIESLVGIAARYPRMLEGLEKAVQVMPWLEIGKFGAGVVVALAVDTGRALPVGLAAEYLGVAEAARQIGWQEEEASMPVDMPAEGFVVTRPPSFHIDG